MGVQELRVETQRRGLGTARSKADLIQRLTDHDAAQDSSVEDDFSDQPADTDAPAADAATATSEAPEATPPADAASPPVPIRAFRQTFQAEPGGPDEETHLAHRDATRQAALEAGHTPRGDARLVDTRGGTWVYEILVRQETPS